MHDKLFEAALGVEAPWYVQGVDFDTARKTLTIAIDFVAGRRFEHPDAPGLPPVHDTRIRRLRHLDFFRHECVPEVRTPRVNLPDGRVAQIEPKRFGKLSGCALSVRGLDPDQGPTDDVCRRCRAGVRVVASRACRLLALCRSCAGRSRFVRRHRGGDR